MEGASCAATKESPTDWRIADHSTLRSTPWRMPSAKPSPSAAAAMNHSWLVTSLTTFPVPQRTAENHGAEYLEDRPDAVDGDRVPAGEQGEPAVAGTIDRPGHR